MNGQQPTTTGVCRVSGRAVSGATPLPGVSVLVRSGDALKTATSTDPNGTYRLTLPAGTYEVAAELTGFARIARPVTIGAPPCDQTVDFQLALAPRVAPQPSSAGAVAAARGAMGGEPAPFRPRTLARAD